jgi:hypothetical protein
MKQLLANLIAMAIICVVIFMLEHAVFSAALQQQRLQRDGRQVGYNHSEFLWDAPGIRDVGHNENISTLIGRMGLRF